MTPTGTDYRYTNENRLEHRFHYMYTPFAGHQFLEAYVRNRRDWLSEIDGWVDDEQGDTRRREAADEIATVLRNCNDRSPGHWRRRSPRLPDEGNETVLRTEDLLLDLWSIELCDDEGRRVYGLKWSERILQRYEVTKRLYEAYNITLKPGNREHRDLFLYALLAALCLYRCRRQPQAKWLNSALKLVDLIISIPIDDYDPETVRLARAVAQCELQVVAQLMTEHRIDGDCDGAALVFDQREPDSEESTLKLSAQQNSKTTILDRVGILAVDSSRTRAYLTAMQQHGLIPRVALLLSPRTKTAPLPESSYFDNSTPAQQALAAMSVETILLQTDDVNDERVISTVEQLDVDCLIYSGPGGAIVQPPLLETGKRLLHVHPGLVPQYRGSTTIYYSLLNEDQCGASAIFLEPQIDCGPVLATKRYPPPDDRTTLDHGYDPWIRADLLIDVLKDYVNCGRFVPADQLPSSQEETYYIMHPVLRHVTILSQRARLPKTCNAA